jgi:hypothetical protein
MKLNAALFAVLDHASAAGAEPDRPIHAATVLDGGKTLKNATIVVQGSKITSIETGGAANASYELGQLTVVPGSSTSTPTSAGISTRMAATHRDRFRPHKRFL